MKRQRDPDDDADQTDQPVKKAHTSCPVVPESVRPVHDSGPGAIQGEITRDKDFYFEKGDFVFKVERTLFKVHRFVLRDSLYFDCLIEILLGKEPSTTSIGRTDEGPMPFYDSVQAFKCLLSLLHALPEELAAQIDRLKRRQSFESLVLLLEITTKYRFKSTGRLVLNLLTEYLKKFTDHLNKTASANLLKRTLVVLTTQGPSKLQDDFASIFATRIPEKAIPPETALEFADTHNLRLLQGAAYYSLTFRVGPNDNADRKLEPHKFGGCGADTRLRQRLLHGYWSLMQCSQILADAPPLSAETCKTLKITKWCRFYASKYKPTLSHPLAMLEECKQGLMEVVDASTGGNAPDRELVVAEIDKVIQQFRDRLMDHFDPLD